MTTPPRLWFRPTPKGAWHLRRSSIQPLSRCGKASHRPDHPFQEAGLPSPACGHCVRGLNPQP